MASWYRLYGLLVESDVPLGPLEIGAGASAVPDVRVRWGPPAPVPDSPAPGTLIAAESASELFGGERKYSVTEDAGGWVVRFHGACDVWVSPDRRTVECRPDPGFDRDLVPVLFVGTVGALLASLGGRLVLHGAGVEIDAGGEHAVVGFIGRSGTGKSTVAALCAAAGAGLVTDDVLAIDVSGRAPRCTGGWPEIRLRSSATAVVDLFVPPPPTRRTADGRLAVRPPSGGLDGARLAALVVPRPSPDSPSVELTRLSLGDALLVVVGAGRIEGWCEPGRQLSQFEAASRVAAAVPVYMGVFPWRQPLQIAHAHDLLTRLST